jgi:hypothetical protein
VPGTSGISPVSGVGLVLGAKADQEQECRSGDRAVVLVPVVALLAVFAIFEIFEVIETVPVFGAAKWAKLKDRQEQPQA